MKTNIKMKCDNNQFRQVIDILKLDYNHRLHYEDMYIIINSHLSAEWGYGGTIYNDSGCEEIDADLFIRTNGTCEEISDEGLSKIKAAFQGKPIEYLQEKVINLHKQINKDRIIIKNQREELNKLNLKLQKSISLEEHHLKMKTVLNEKHKLEVENKSLKESSKISCNMIHQQRDTIVSLRDEVIIKVDNMRDTKNKEIENLKAVIEYLESKLK